MRRIIVITGTPGVGKSSVSRVLASKINAHLISIGELVEREKLYSGVNRRRNTLVADIDKVSRRIREIMAEVSGDIMIEGHFAVDVVPPEEVTAVFVLRRDPEELKGILESRSYSERKVRENLAAEILDVCLHDAIRRCGVKKVCEVNVTSRDVEEVVQEIMEVLNGTRGFRVGIVNWLGKLESEGKLDEYLKGF